MPQDFLDAGGLRIRYQRAGVGAPVLLLHGWGGRIESMAPIFDAVAAHCDAVSIDFPGHGESSLPPRPWTVSDFLDCTIQVMDQLGLANPHIVAHSFGGRVTIKLAAAHPHRVNRILFTAGAGVKPPLSFGRKLKRAAAHIGGILPGTLRERLRPYLASRDYVKAGSLRPTLAHVLGEDLTPYLGSIRSKCLLVWGDQDRETPLYCAHTMKRLIPDSELIVFAGAGHFPYLDQVNKFNLLAMRFLRGEDA